MNCQHQTKAVVPTPETIHHAKEVCSVCGAFIRWLPKPETLERQKREAEQRASLFRGPLTDWEKSFLMSVEKQAGKMSPKQREIFERMVKHYAV